MCYGWSKKFLETGKRERRAIHPLRDLWQSEGLWREPMDGHLMRGGGFSRRKYTDAHGIGRHVATEIDDRSFE